MEIAEAPEFTCPIGIVQGFYGVRTEAMNTDLQDIGVQQRSLIKTYLNGEDKLGTSKTKKPNLTKILNSRNNELQLSLSVLAPSSLIP